MNYSNSERINTSKRNTANKQLKTRLANSGRIAGTGVLYDRYDEESGGWVYGRENEKVMTPYDYMTKEQKAELNGPVITYHIDDLELGR